MDIIKSFGKFSLIVIVMLFAAGIIFKTDADVPANAETAQIAYTQEERVMAIEVQKAQEKARIAAQKKAVKKLNKTKKQVQKYIKKNNKKYSKYLTSKQKKNIKKYKKKVKEATSIKQIKKWKKKIVKIYKKAKEKKKRFHNTGPTNFRSRGVIYHNGHRFTYYSSNVLYHYRTSEWTPDNLGFYRDKDGYLVVAADFISQGSKISTPWGIGKKYDCGAGSNTVDMYVCW